MKAAVIDRNVSEEYWKCVHSSIIKLSKNNNNVATLLHLTWPTIQLEPLGNNHSQN